MTDSALIASLIAVWLATSILVYWRGNKPLAPWELPLLIGLQLAQPLLLGAILVSSLTNSRNRSEVDWTAMVVAVCWLLAVLTSLPLWVRMGRTRRRLRRGSTQDG